MKKLFFFFFFIFIILSGIAQKNELEFEEIYDQNGNSFFDILEIKQDAKGFLWFMRFINGMYRYDGNSVLYHKYYPNDSTTVQSYGSSYFFGDEGELLINVRSENKVVDFYSLKNNRNSQFTKLVNDSVSFDKIIKDKDGILWILEGTDVYSYNKKNQKLKEGYSPFSDNLLDYINNKDEKIIAELSHISNLQDTVINFTIDKDNEIMLACIGEGDVDMFDYGMLLKGEDTIWKMNYNNTRYAGGALKNRIEIKILNFKKGNYNLRYISDDSHSFNNWNEPKPTLGNFYGVRIFESPEKIANINNLISSEIGDVYNIFLNNEERISMLTSKGLYVQNSNKEFEFTEFDWFKATNMTPTSYAFDDIYADHIGNVWWLIGGILKIDLKEKDATLIHNDRCNALAIDKHRNGMWFAYNDLFFYDFQTKSILTYDNSKLINKLKEGEHIRYNDIFIDKTGNIFLVTNKGIFKNSTKKIKFYHPETEYRTSDCRAAYYKDNCFYYLDAIFENHRKYVLRVYDFESEKTDSFIIDRNIDWRNAYIFVSNENKIWISQKNILLLFDKDNNTFTDSIESDSRILSVYQSEDQKTWVFTLNKVYQLEKNKLIPRADLKSNEYGKNNIIDYILNLNNKLIIRTFAGVYIFDIETYKIKEIYKFKEEFKNENYFFGNIIFDNDNNTLWFSTEAKLISYNLNNEKIKENLFIMHSEINYYNLRNRIYHSGVVQNDNIIWISTGNGFYKFDLNTKQFSHFTEKNGLIDNTIADMYMDNFGKLWFSTNFGISKFNPENESFINYHRGGDYLDNYFFHNISDSIFHLGDERGFFGTLGICSFIPDNINKIPPTVAITYIEINDKEYIPDSAVYEKKLIKVDYTNNFITFEFVALDYTDPRRNQYAYMLEGVDKDWIYTDYKDRKAKYTNLAPGKYTFRVKASNNDGVWNEEGVSLKIIITPPFWKTWWFYTLEVLAGILLIIALIKFRERKLKRDNVKLEKTVEERTQEVRLQSEEIKAQNDELNSRNEEILTQRDTVVKQKEEIEEIHEHITDSINYATRIQASILPNENILKEFLSDHFVLFNPKDKVSGDFYWWSHIENHTIITAADCTGHGVPGAFMSMLGVSFLREIVNKEYITHTGVILRKLRKEIINALRQKGNETGSQDGMDMALISINHEKNSLQFSGANNSLYIIRKGKLETKNDKVFEFDMNGNNSNGHRFYEIKPDRMPIAIYLKMDKFTTHEIELQKGDNIYMFSDGYADQFGGPDERKFKYKQFKQLLFENVDKPMAKQKDILEKNFLEWKGEIEQIDDVVVLGIRI
ncbi:MAG: SpoIIE family protein phosphatase [Bacteroidales bacterium]|nr:SpoIIE family protein phosphatase [Bacteroidales bacterium]